MSLPYENASSGDKAIGEMQKILRTFGCSKFGTMVDDDAGILIVQFEHKGRPLMVKGSVKGYAAAWLRHHPYNSRTRCSKVEHQRKAMAIASIAVYSMVRDWIKGQITAVEVGLLTFEGAFLGQIMLPTGQTILETLQTRSEFAAIAGPAHTL